MKSDSINIIGERLNCHCHFSQCNQFMENQIKSHLTCFLIENPESHLSKVKRTMNMSKFMLTLITCSFSCFLSRGRY